MHLQRDSVALKIEGCFFFFLADSCFRGGNKIAHFCLGVHLFLKLFNSAGVRNVYLCCGNDQAAKKSAWGQRMTKVHRPSAPPCGTLWHGEGCSPCSCCGASTPLPGHYKIWDCTWRPAGESPWEPELPGNAVFATRDAKAYYLQTECLIRAPLGTGPLYHTIAWGWVAFVRRSSSEV